MKLLLSILSLLCIIIFSQGVPSPRVLGGRDAELGQFPYIVQLNRRSALICAGSIIDQRWILTAAHCVHHTAPKDLTIIVGTINRSGRNGTSYAVESIYAHENFKVKATALGPINDIALIRLAKDISFNENVQKLQLPVSNLKTLDDEVVTLSGWGSIKAHGRLSSKLQHINLQVLDQRTCNQTWMDFADEEIVDSKICTTSDVAQGSCHGDSGGPLASNRTLIGIVSYGWPCGTGVPDIFTRVSSYLEWIRSKMNLRV